VSSILEVKNLKKYFKTSRGLLHAVDDVSFTVEAGRTFGLVGESGCGKSTLGRLLTHLVESTGGQMLFEGKDITRLNKVDTKEYRKHAQIIFQDPYASLDPRKTVRQTISEPFVIRRELTKQEMRAKVNDLMALVGLAERFAEVYPHELDGGRRQRIGIARALALEPKFIVCDEPVSALDVSIQAQIINLLQDLQDKLGLAYLFITHDLSVVEYISNDIAVMYLGQIVEKASSETLFENPLHPYTKTLLSAIPVPDVHHIRERIVAKGEITSPINPAPGCRFAARCHYTTEECSNPQTLEEVESYHFVSCCKAKEINDIK
jgi:peptide/nickel transport system ATP-binding protein